MPVAFSLRYNIAQGIDSKPEYQRFIDQYPSTIAAHNALHQLFHLSEDAQAQLLQYGRQIKRLGHIIRTVKFTKKLWKSAPPLNKVINTLPYSTKT
jgi:hypothetical protein